MASGNATYCSRCSQEHPNLKKEILKLYLIYIKKTLNHKIRNTLKLKKKKFIYSTFKPKKNCNKAKPTASSTDSEVANPPTDSQKKKKKKAQRIRNQTHGHVAGRESRENQTPIQSIQSKSKTNSNIEVFIKKKNPIQSKPKPNQKKTQYSLVIAIARSSSSSSLAHSPLLVVTRCSPLIIDRSVPVLPPSRFFSV